MYKIYADPAKGDYQKQKKQESCKSFDLQDSIVEREGFESKLTPLITI